MLSERPFVFVGRISYSLYLYHWPILVLSRYAGLPATPTWWVGETLMLVALSYTSYRFVETPFLVTVGPGTQVSDDVGFATAEYSATAFRTRPVTLGGSCFLGNALTLPPGTSLGRGCFVGTKTHVPAGVTVPDGTGMLGAPPFRTTVSPTVSPGW